MISLAQIKIQQIQAEQRKNKEIYYKKSKIQNDRKQENNNTRNVS